MDFAAIVPKGDYVTVALLGEKMDNELCDRFLKHPTGESLHATRLDA